MQYKISKYSIKKNQCDEEYRIEAIKELTEAIQELPKKISSFTFYWRGKVISISDTCIIASVICEIIDIEMYNLCIQSKLSDFTYSYIEIN